MADDRLFIKCDGCGAWKMLMKQMDEKHYTDWKAIDTNRAQQAICRGAKVFALPGSFFRGGASYEHGLQTKRDACYVVSKLVMRGLILPEQQ